MPIQDSSKDSYQFRKLLQHQWKPASIVFLVVVSVSTVLTFLQKPSFLAEGTLAFRRSGTTPSLTGLGKEITEISSLREQTSPVDTEIEIIRSAPLVFKAISILDLKDSKGKALSLNDFLKKLKITSIKGTDVIQLSYEHQDPNIASAVVNTLMNIYLEENINSYRAIASIARQFVEKQLPFAEEKVRKAELDLREFREKNSVVSLEEEQKGSVQFLLTFQNQFTAAQAQLSDTEAQLKIIQDRLGVDPDRAVYVTAVSQSKGVQDLLTEKQLLESQLASERTRYQDSHPVIEALRSRINALNVLLRERIDLVVSKQPGKEIPTNTTQIGSLQQDLAAQSIQLEAKQAGLANQLRSLIDVEETYKKRVDTLPKLEQKQRELARYLDAAQSTYTLLLRKGEELRITEAQSTGNAKIVTPALVPQLPSGISKLSSIVINVVVALIIAFIIAKILDYNDKSIQNAEDATYVYDFPLLGEIPIVDVAHREIVTTVANVLPPQAVDRLDQDKSVPIRDSSAVLGQNLKVLNIKKSIKVITVTSVEKEEGKSTVASYLAASLAQLGEKVVLVDLNLHNPCQHNIWCFDNHIGLSDVFVNSLELDLAMVESMPNLSLLSSGSIPISHPISILDTPKMEIIIRQLSSKYDYVIIDTPAIRVSPDALFLSKLSDGMLLVVRPNVSTLDSAAYLKEILAQSEQSIFAQVINGVRAKND